MWKHTHKCTYMYALQVSQSISPAAWTSAKRKQTHTFSWDGGERSIAFILLLSHLFTIWHSLQRLFQSCHLTYKRETTIQSLQTRNMLLKHNLLLDANCTNVTQSHLWNYSSWLLLAVGVSQIQYDERATFPYALPIRSNQGHIPRYIEVPHFFFLVRKRPHLTLRNSTPHPKTEYFMVASGSATRRAIPWPNNKHTTGTQDEKKTAIIQEWNPGDLGG